MESSVCISPTNDEMSFLIGNHWLFPLWRVELRKSEEVTVKADIAIVHLHLPESKRIQRQLRRGTVARHSENAPTLLFFGLDHNMKAPL